MGAIDETRKVVQDFLAPEVRTLTAEIRSLVSNRRSCGVSLPLRKRV